MDDEVLPLFPGNKGIEAVRTPERGVSVKAAFIRSEPGITHLTENLPFAVVVFIKIRLGSIAAWTLTVIRNITDRASAYRSIAPLNVRDVITIVTDFAWKNFWKFIDFKLLVFFWGSGSHQMLTACEG